MNITKRVPWLVAFAVVASCQSSGGGQRFDVENEFEIQVPEGTREVRAWFALPDDKEPLQEVASLETQVDGAPEGARVETKEVRDADGNRFLYMTARDAGGSAITVATTFEVRRREATHSTDPAATRPLTNDETREMVRYLGDGKNIVATPAIRRAAADAVGDEKNPMIQARLLYTWVLDHVQYWVKFPETMKSSGVGSSVYCYEECTGNCTDFHSLYAAGARSVGLPTRMVYGSFFKGPLDGVDQDQSYHCWIEFWAPNLGWTPLDVAIADVFVADFELTDANSPKVELTVADGYAGPDAEMVEYYFGNLDSRRVTWNRGRDLTLDPPTASGPVNALPKAHVEADGAVLSDWTRKLTFTEIR